MGASGYYRDLSPRGGRHHHMADPMRASTGTVQLGSSHDPYQIPRRRHDHDEYSSDVPHGNAYGHRSSRASRLEAQPTSSHTFRGSDHSTKKLTEYTVRPRPRSNTATDVHDKTPRLAVPRSHHPPAISSGRGRSPSPLPPDHGRHLMPPSLRDGGRHRRVYSNEYASDTGRQHYDNARVRAPHDDPRAHTSGGRRHPAYDKLKKGEDIDGYDAYSYTTPREQFDRDYPVRKGQPMNGYRTARPVSMTGPEDPSQWLARNEQRHRGPPPTYRGFDKLDRDARLQYGSEDAREAPRSRDGYHGQALVPVHHEPDDGYWSHQDDYADSRHRRHHRHRRSRHNDGRDRQLTDDGPPRTYNGGDERFMAGLGTAALGGGYAGMSDYDHRSTRPRHTHSRESEHGYDPVKPPTRELADNASPSPERKKQLYLEPGHAHEHNRARTRPIRRAERDADAYSSDEDPRNYRHELSAAAHHPRHSSTDTSSSESERPPRSTQDRSRRHQSSRPVQPPDEDRSNDLRYSRSVDSKNETRKPITVDPPLVKEPDAPPPKGILKKPRESFPEEPNPVREGVAPLKDAHQSGIPPGARWTKIDRRLVNPAALEAGNERFEERAEYVIVLRVLTKEEIQAYAVKTQEIRDARQEEYREEQHRRRDQSHRQGRRNDESSSESEEDDGAQRTIEAPPPPEPQKLTVPSSFPSRRRASSHTGQMSERPTTNPPAAHA